MTDVDIRYQLVQTNRKVLLNIETLITHYYLATRFKRPCVDF